jgi:Leucine-rich repeat (LRR) protein
MRTTFLTCCIAISALCHGQNIVFPDTAFKSALLNYTPAIDINGDNEIDSTEALAPLQLIFSDKGITDFTGLSHFKKITVFVAEKDSVITIDFSGNTLLESISIRNNETESVVLGKCTELLYLTIEKNKLDTIDLSQNTLLATAHLNENKLSHLNVSKNINLIRLECGYNSLSQLDVSKNILLTYLSCSVNSLSNLDLTNNQVLESLAFGSNSIDSLDLSHNPELTSLEALFGSLKTLDLSNNLQLQSLNISYHQLSTIVGFSNLTKLTNLFLVNNQLTELNVANMLYLYSADVTLNSGLSTICVSAHQLESLVSLWSKDTEAQYSTSNCQGVTVGTQNIQVSTLIYPNPAINHISVSEKAKMIISQTGERVTVNLQELSIDISSVANGLYFVLFESGKTEKLIIK